MSLSVPALVLFALTVFQVVPKSIDLATLIRLFLFCSHDAYTVLPSTGSTLICTSTCPEPGSAMIFGRDQVRPVSLLTMRHIVGLGQLAHPGIAGYAVVLYCGKRMYTCPNASAAIAGSH